MTEQLTRLHWADYVVIVVCLLVALGIGVFFALFRGGQNTREAYLMGNRRMGLVPVALSLFISFQSAISLIGFPSDTYNTGTMIFYISVGISLANVVAHFTLVPLVYPLRLTSIYHYLQLRFRSYVVKTIITVIAMLQTSLYMGIALYTPALVLEAVAGLSLWMSLVLVGSVGTIYTAIGGYKSVIWTDVFQTVIVFSGIATVLIKGLIDVGGFTNMATIASDGGRLIFAELDPRERHSVWSTTIGACFMWMVYVFNQTTVQRVCSLPSLSHAKRIFYLNTPLCLLYGSTLVLMGIILYAYFVTTGCDPYAAGYVKNKNQVAPYFVVQVLKELPGITGLYMSMLFCGALSTLSSGINALAAITVEDVLAKPLTGMKDTTVTLIAKGIVAEYGCLSLALAYLMQNLSGPVTQMSDSVVGAFGSPVLGVFFLSAGFPRCNVYGAGGGIVMGSALSLVMAVGSTLYGAPTPYLPPGPVDRCDDTNNTTTWTTLAPSMWNVTVVTLGEEGRFTTHNTTTAGPHVNGDSGFSVWDISYLWFSVIGFWGTVLSGIVISLLTEPEDTTEEDNAFSLTKPYEKEIPEEDGMETSSFIS
ncbi:sodium-coupled monocarboxylate transporter 2-like [Babylonia areolata]|uniref:sodium-coupled monocarboxylate transporter 2-like n=1 Tax=Babylonia areolata TaxID=304850 RepID=UPI003FCF830E